MAARPAGSPLRAIETYSAVMDPKTGRLAFASQDNGAGLSSPTATISQIMPGAPWQKCWADGFSVAVNSKTAGGPSIFYATADDPRLARTFANENLSPASPPNLLNINVAGTGGQGFFGYQADNANGIVVAVNAVDPTGLLFRSSRLYTWTDPGRHERQYQCHRHLQRRYFRPLRMGRKSRLRDAGRARHPGGRTASIQSHGSVWDIGVYLRTQEQVNAGNTTVGPSNLLTSFQSANGGNPGDPLTCCSIRRPKTNSLSPRPLMSQPPATLAKSSRPWCCLRTSSNPIGLTYIADATGGANNVDQAPLVGGILDVVFFAGRHHSQPRPLRQFRA